MTSFQALEALSQVFNDPLLSDQSALKQATLLTKALSYYGIESKVVQRAISSVIALPKKGNPELARSPDNLYGIRVGGRVITPHGVGWARALTYAHEKLPRYERNVDTHFRLCETLAPPAWTVDYLDPLINTRVKPLVEALAALTPSPIEGHFLAMMSSSGNGSTLGIMPDAATAKLAGGLVTLLSEQGIQARAFTQEQCFESAEWRLMRRRSWLELEGGQHLDVREDEDDSTGLGVCSRHGQRYSGERWQKGQALEWTSEEAKPLGQVTTPQSVIEQLRPVVAALVQQRLEGVVADAKGSPRLRL